MLTKDLKTDDEDGYLSQEVRPMRLEAYERTLDRLLARKGLRGKP